MDTQLKTHNKSWAYVLVAICAVGIGLAVPGFLDMVVALGHNIPQEDLATDYVTAVVWAMALGVSILAWPVRSGDKRGLLWVWLAKSLVTLGFMLFYESNYSLDSYGYFDEPRQSGFAWEGLKIGSGIESGTDNITNLAWLHNQLLPDSYHALKVSFAMVGLIAVYLFYRAAVLFLKREDRRVFYALAFFPSILFWSSIIGKDPIVLLGIALYVYGVVSWYRFKQLRYFFVLALGIMVAIFIRVWLGPILLMPLVIFALRGIRGIVARTTFMIFAIVAFLFSFHQFKDQFSLETKQDLIAHTDFLSKGFSTGGSAWEVSMEFTSISDMIVFVPIGAFTALFRPLPGEVLNPFGLLAGMESLFLLILLLLSLKRLRCRWRELRQPLVIWAILLIVIWAAVYGFIGFNLGTVCRYRLQILPILLGLLLYLSRERDSLANPKNK